MHPSERGRLKQLLLKIGWPAEDHAGYVDGEAHAIALDENGWKLRDYQRLAAQAFWAGGSGVVVLPCGAGKTLVGAAAMAEAQATTLILVTNTVAGRQWKRELIARTSLTEEEIGEYSGERKEIRPVTIATYQVITRKSKGEYKHLELFDSRDWGLIVYDEVHLLPAPVFRMTADLQSRRRLGLTATLVREDGQEGDVFSLIGPKRYDVPWRDIEAQGWIAPAECTEVRVTLTDNERLQYATAEPEERYKLCSTARTKIAVVKRILERHPDEPTLVIGAYLDQLDELGEELDAPVIKGSTKNREREELFDKFRKGELRTLVVSKVANFSIDLPEATRRGAGVRHVRVAAGGGPAPRQAAAAQGRRAAGALLLGRLARHARHRLRGAPAAVPGRAGLRVQDRRRGRPGHMTFWWMWNPAGTVPQRRFRSEESLARSAPGTQVVRSTDFTCPEQRRRATAMRADFHAVTGDPVQVALVEQRLWTLLVALRRAQPIRDALALAAPKAGRAALVAEPTRELAEFDRRFDQFALALRVLVTDPTPEQLRHTAALD